MFQLLLLNILAQNVRNKFDSYSSVHPPLQPNPIQNLLQVCLLCESQFASPALLAAHVFDTHGIDMAQILASEPVLEKKKKIPNLVKITDLRNKNEHSGRDSKKSFFFFLF